MRSGDETDWTFAVPSRRHPRYVIFAVDEMVAVPEPFAIAVRHPERFDGLWLARGPNAREVLRRIDTCLSNEIVM